MKTDLELIRDACIRANPDLKQVSRVEISNGEVLVEYENIIGLCDVLLAMEAKQGRRKPSFETDVLAVWNLRQDRLEDQSEPTKRFLAELLSNKVV